jgi:hypothetical protein
MMKRNFNTFYWQVVKAKGDNSFEKVARDALFLYYSDPDRFKVKRKVTFFSLYNCVRAATYRHDLRPIVEESLGMKPKEITITKVEQPKMGLVKVA